MGREGAFLLRYLIKIPNFVEMSEKEYIEGLPQGLWFREGLPMAGGVLMAIGISLFITYFAGKKLLKKEMEKED